MRVLYASGTRRAEIERRMAEHARIWSSPVGARRRREFWREHGCFCDRCGWHPGAWLFRRDLEVHHLHYRDDTGYEDDDTLRALCTRCHDSGWKRSVHYVHRARYVWGRRFDHQDLWPRKHLEHVTKSLIRRSWWRRALRRKP